MNSAIERLLKLRVSDVMTRRVIDVSRKQTMAEAAATLIKHEISAAPVVDEFGHCIGMLTGMDFLKQRGDEHQQHPAKRTTGRAPSVDLRAKQTHRLKTVGDEIASRMSDTVQSIAADATVVEAARAMCIEHVHHLPVLDEDQCVLGLVSSLDIVAAMVHAVEE